MLDRILTEWGKSPYNRQYKDPCVHAVPLHIHGYLELGCRRFGWDPLDLAGAPLVSAEVLRAARNARSLTMSDMDRILRPTMVFHGQCRGLNRILRERLLADAPAGTVTSALSVRS